MKQTEGMKLTGPHTLLMDNSHEKERKETSTPISI